MIRSNAVTDCWVFILAGLNSRQFSAAVLYVPSTFVITPSPVAGCDHAGPYSAQVKYYTPLC